MAITIWKGFWWMGRPKEYTAEVVEDLAKKLVRWYEEDESRIFLVDFCIAHKFNRQRLVEFAADNQIFSDSLKKAKDYQLSRLLKLGLSHNQKTTMAIFSLKTVCGLREQDDTQQNITINNYSADKEDKEDIEKYMKGRIFSLNEKKKRKKVS